MRKANAGDRRRNIGEFLMSTMKIWLKAKAISQINDQKPKFYGADVRVSEQSGGKFVTLYLDPTDPTVDMPRFSREFVRMITHSDTYHEGFRPEGVYKFASARAVVKTEVRVSTPYGGNASDSTSIERRQTISISAKNIKDLREIYTKIRQGVLSPSEIWSMGGESGVTLNEVHHNGF